MMVDNVISKAVPKILNWYVYPIALNCRIRMMVLVSHLQLTSQIHLQGDIDASEDILTRQKRKPIAGMEPGDGGFGIPGGRLPGIPREDPSDSEGPGFPGFPAPPESPMLAVN